jgi:hypothetical protein
MWRNVLKTEGAINDVKIWRIGVARWLINAPQCYVISILPVFKLTLTFSEPNAMFLSLSVAAFSLSLCRLYNCPTAVTSAGNINKEPN